MPLTAESKERYEKSCGAPINRVDRPSYSNARRAREGAEKRNEVAGTMTAIAEGADIRRRKPQLCLPTR